jgi:aminocarboxymuconate-semialdehyde decarboxylase
MPVDSRPTECIDVFCHFLPAKYCQAVQAAATRPLLMLERAQRIRAMVDLQARLRVLDEFPGVRQIISLASPPTEAMAPHQSAALAALANDELAATVDAAGDRICGFAATLPLDDVPASLQEAQRAAEQLGAVGVQVFTSVLGKPLDDPVFEPLFALLDQLRLPVLLHPTRTRTTPDYVGEPCSKFDLWWAVGWPYETTLAMTRLAFSGIFDRHPHLKIVAHHAGGYLPMLAGRLGPGMQLLGTRNPPEAACHVETTLREPVLRACQRFYADTATFGSRAALECSQAFFGADRLLFASDMPFDAGGGPDYIRSTLDAIAEMDLTDLERQQILSHNARRLFRLND